MHTYERAYSFTHTNWFDVRARIRKSTQNIYTHSCNLFFLCDADNTKLSTKETEKRKKYNRRCVCVWPRLHRSQFSQHTLSVRFEYTQHTFALAQEKQRRRWWQKNNDHRTFIEVEWATKEKQRTRIDSLCCSNLLNIHSYRRLHSTIIFSSLRFTIFSSFFFFWMAFGTLILVLRTQRDAWLRRSHNNKNAFIEME